MNQLYEFVAQTYGVDLFECRQSNQQVDELWERFDPPPP